MARLGVGAWAACLLALSCALITSSSAQGSAAAEHSAQAASQPAQVPHNPLDLWRVENVQLAAQPGAKLWTSAAELRASGEWLEVFWSGVVRPRPDDLIALYVPATADPRKAAPVKFQWADRAATHRSVGAGTLRFRVLNLRQDFKFVLLRGGLQFPRVAAESAPIKNLAPNEPTQGHFSLTGRPGEVVVQWVTRDKGTPQVRWGTQPGVYTHAAPAESITYTRQDLCGPPANDAGWADPGMLHAAVVGGLEPGLRYYYVYGDEEWGWSEEASFRGAPPAGRDATVRVLAVADMGQAEPDGCNEVSDISTTSRNTTDLMAAEPLDEYDLLIHNGDISYARGHSTQWDNFFDQLAPLARRLPYMTCIGNHERDWPGSGDRFPSQYDSGGECGVPYYRHTRMPTPSEDEPWYSFDLGPIHFVQYSTEHEFEPGSPQHSFIEQDLKSVDRAKTPWVVLGGHRPMYIDSTFGWPPDGDQYVAGQLQASLERLLYCYGVDVTWHGHHHSLQRTCPVLRGRCVPPAADGTAGAPVHLVIGHAGAVLTPNVSPQRPEVFETVKLEHGYLRVTANATHMVHQVVSSASGGLMDEFTLTKPPGWTFTPRKLEGDEEGEGVGAGSSGAGVLRVGGPAPYPGDAAMVAAA